MLVPKDPKLLLVGGTSPTLCICLHNFAEWAIERLHIQSICLSSSSSNVRLLTSGGGLEGIGGKLLPKELDLFTIGGRVRCGAPGGPVELPVRGDYWLFFCRRRHVWTSAASRRFLVQISAQKLSLILNVCVKVCTKLIQKGAYLQRNPICDKSA